MGNTNSSTSCSSTISCFNTDVQDIATEIDNNAVEPTVAADCSRDDVAQSSGNNEMSAEDRARMDYEPVEIISSNGPAQAASSSTSTPPPYQAHPAVEENLPEVILGQEVGRAIEENFRLTQRINQQERFLNSLNDSVHQLGRHAETLLEEVRHNDTETQNLRRDFITANQVIARRFDHQDEQMNPLQESVAELNQTITQHGGSLEQLNQHAANIHGQVQQQQESLNNISASQTNQNASINRVSGDIQALRQLHQQAMAELTETVNRNAQEQDEYLNEIDERLEANGESIAEVNGRVADLQHSMEQLTGTVNGNNASIAEVNGRVAELQQRHQTSINTLNGTLNGQTASINHVDQRVVALQGQLQQQQANFEQFRELMIQMFQNQNEIIQIQNARILELQGQTQQLIANLNQQSQTLTALGQQQTQTFNAIEATHAAVNARGVENNLQFVEINERIGRFEDVLPPRPARNPAEALSYTMTIDQNHLMIYKELDDSYQVVVHKEGENRTLEKAEAKALLVEFYGSEALAIQEIREFNQPRNRANAAQLGFFRPENIHVCQRAAPAVAARA